MFYRVQGKYLENLGSLRLFHRRVLFEGELELSRHELGRDPQLACDHPHLQIRRSLLDHFALGLSVIAIRSY
jgi:hypothetical protein